MIQWPPDHLRNGYVGQVHTDMLFCFNKHLHVTAAWISIAGASSDIHSVGIYGTSCEDTFTSTDYVQR